MINSIVWVDRRDNVLGLKEKFSAHKIPVPLHRAISIIIFNKDKSKMLITKRAITKPTWGGFWSNAVCSHPFPEESYQKAAERRLKEELGIKTDLKDTFNFIYSAKTEGGIWGENELDHVFVGVYSGEVNPNLEEIDEYKWINVLPLKKDIKNNPNKYTPWFNVILEKLM
jgi:isopentenyl-diphosphate Delta-isomerase